MDIPQVQGEGIVFDVQGKKTKNKNNVVVQGFPPLVNLIGVSEWMYEMVAVEKCDCAGVSPNVRT